MKRRLCCRLEAAVMHNWYFRVVDASCCTSPARKGKHKTPNSKPTVSSGQADVDTQSIPFQSSKSCR